MKKIILTFIVILMLTVSAVASDARVVIGGDLTDEQIATVYADFGIERGDVEEIILTNDVEREYLAGIVDDDMLGTKSISCAYVVMGTDGVSVETNNTNYCTSAMYISSMATAGIDDTSVIVSAPFEVSGTAAMVGIYLAYEEMTSEDLSSDAKIAGVMELVTTAGIADSIEDIDSSAIITIVSELKLKLSDIEDMSDEELIAEIDSLADTYNVPLTDYHRETLVTMLRSMEKLDSDAIAEATEKAKETLEKMGEYKDTAVSIWSAISAFFAAIANLFSEIMAIFG